MLVQLCVFFLLLLILFLLTRQLTNLVFRLFLLITRNQKTAIIFLTALLLPGTTIHELSHLCAAFILRVPTGKITIIPKIRSFAHGPGGEGRREEIQAGSVMVGRSDPFRLTLIGLAPVPVGIMLLYATTQFFFPFWSLLAFLHMTDSQRIPALIGVYFLFTISCSMFSSKKDLKALLISGPVLLIALFLFYWSGIRIGVSADAAAQWIEKTQYINTVLGITACVDGILILLLLIPRHIARRSLRHHHSSS